MSELFSSADRAVFFFINRTLSNPVFDWLMPFLTDLNKSPIALAITALLLLWMLVKGKKAGRTAGIILILTIIVSDQLSSSVIKQMFARLRPCHVLQGVRLLVDCGSGYSFPSSHAVNNFAAATVLSHYYRKYRWGWFSFASLIAFTRPYVGVHYPSDAIGGAAIGWACAYALILSWEYVNRNYVEKGAEV